MSSLDQSGSAVRPASTRSTALAWCLTGAVFFAAAVLHLSLPLNHDAAWVLLGAERMLQGGQFGRDVVDVNPPLAWWLNMGPALLAEISGLALGLTFKLCVLGLAGLSAAFCHRLMARAGMDGKALWTMTLALAAAFTLAPGYDFGQREHLMVMLASPYLCLSVLRMTGDETGGGEAVAAGLMAAAGFCLKPYFLAIPCAIELCLLTGNWNLRRLFRSENRVMLGFGMLYVIAAYASAPAWFTEVLPAVVQSYDAYDSTWTTIARNATSILLPLCLGLFIFWIACKRNAPGAGARVFLAAAGGALIAALAQKKGWPYHLYPALAFGTLALASLVVEAGRGAWTRTHAASLFAVAIIGLSLGRGPVNLIIDATKPEGGTGLAHEMARTIAENTPAQGRVFAFITSPRTVVPAALEAERDWASSACCVHFLPAAILDAMVTDTSAAEQTTARAENAARQLSEIADDLTGSPPDIIIVDAARYKLGFGTHAFDYLDYLRRDPWFAAIFEAYREIEPVGTFRLFLRRPAA